MTFFILVGSRIAVSVKLFVLRVVRVTLKKTQRALLFCISGRNNKLLFHAWLSYYKTCHCAGGDSCKEYLYVWGCNFVLGKAFSTPFTAVSNTCIAFHMCNTNFAKIDYRDSNTLNLT